MGNMCLVVGKPDDDNSASVFSCLSVIIRCCVTT